MSKSILAASLVALVGCGGTYEEEDALSSSEWSLLSHCAPSSTGAVVNVRTRGAKGDGIKDDTAAFNEAIRTLPAGGTLFVPDGVYLINPVNGSSAKQGVVLKSNMKLRLADNAVLKAIPNGAGHYSVVTAYGVANVSIVGGRLLGDRSTHTAADYKETFHEAPPVFDQHEWGMGLSIRGSSNVFVDTVSAEDFTGDGFYLSGGPGLNTNVTFCNVVANHNRRTGLSMTQVNGVLIRDSVFSNTKGTPLQVGIDIELDRATESIKNVKVQGTRFFGNEGGGLVVYSGKGTNFSGLVFEGNSFIDTPAQRRTAISIGSPTQGADGSIVKNNKFKSNFWGIDLRGNTTGTVVSGNAFCSVAGAMRNNGKGVALNTNFDGNSVSGNSVSCEGL